jgi:hypothetical protein
VVVGILAYYAKGREFDSRTVQKFVYMNMFGLVLGVSMDNMYAFTKKVNKYLISINPLSRINNTSLISAYFELDSRECKCLEVFRI